MNEPSPGPTVLIANPTADLYGSDLQMLESVAGLRAHGWRVVVAVPGTGPLVARLQELGAEVRVVGFPVLRRADATPAGLAQMLLGAWGVVRSLRELVRRERATLVYVNTITLPWWLAAARSAGVPALCHLHEAEEKDARVVRQLLAAPLRMADLLVVNSESTRTVLAGVDPALGRRARLVYNGVALPVARPLPAPASPCPRLLVLGRLSPRKAPHVALEAAGLLRRQGREVELELCGTAAPGAGDYVAGLRARADLADLRGAVVFSGYVSPVWPALERSHIVLAPSLGESFGNATVEAQGALRPVVATAVQGHLETIEDGVSGVLVPTLDVTAMATAVARLLDDPAQAAELAARGRDRAVARFGAERYRSEIHQVVSAVSSVRASTRVSLTDLR